jgi:hypothetical protein
LLEKEDDYCSRVTPFSTYIPAEWLAKNCYIDSSTLISEYEDITSLQYCEVCRHYRPDWFKTYCYYRSNNNNIDNNNDNGRIISSSNQSISNTNHKINRRQITICMKCLDEYNHKECEQKVQRLDRFVSNNNACLNNGNGKWEVTIGGVIDIETAGKAKEKIMLALKLAIITNNNKKNSAAITSDVDEVDDEYLFYEAVRMAYDHSEDVRRYFRNNPSKVRPKNAALWPLRYQAYKEYSI